MQKTHYIILISALNITFCANAHAQSKDKDKSTREHASNAASQPLKDTNLKKNKIPKKLKEVQKAPYSLKGLTKCAAIMSEVKELNEVLGADVNEKVEKSKTEKREKPSSRVAGGIIGGIIPFRGLVREVSGASKAQRKYNKAVYAGVVRRGFLKGVGRERGCKAPARP